MFRVVLHPSSGAHITVITAPGAGQTVSAAVRYHEGVGSVPTPSR